MRVGCPTEIKNHEYRVGLTPESARELVLQDNGYPDLARVAAALCVSTRTLKRRLQRHGTSFMLLLEECRRRDAQHLLSHSTLSVQAIAARLGYQNPANFSRAFSRWTGESPRAARQRLREAGSGNTHD